MKIFLVNIELSEDYKVQVPAGVCFAPSEELNQTFVMHHKAFYGKVDGNNWNMLSAGFCVTDRYCFQCSRKLEC